MKAIISFFSNIVDWIFSIFSALWEWFLGLLESFAALIFAGISAALPDNLQEYVVYLDQFKPYLKFVNTFVALDIALYLFGFFISFVLIFIVVKLVVKFIPSIG